ncbi:Hypothetical protein PHPALM_19038, partial [Phytophthora palmivora]
MLSAVMLRTLTTRGVPAVCSSRLAPTIGPAVLSVSFSSPAANRRARRLRRAKASKASSPDPRTPSILADIEQLSRNGLAQRVEMPTELLGRLTSVIRGRTHSQLETLRQKHVGDRRNTRQVPLDMSKTPLGWTMDRNQQIPPFVYGPGNPLAYLSYEMEATYACT